MVDNDRMIDHIVALVEERAAAIAAQADAETRDGAGEAAKDDAGADAEHLAG
ncbi:MAG: hypothetical protein KatS3mg118_2789 [Paracoccaceae bacterium]|nr:MAG: hypothetical protein KatS3mg118_2789 [Paracoccaceae bacterium]